MNYFFLIAALLAGIHGYTFARWLWQEGNGLGAIGVSILIAISLVLPIYRIINAG